MAASARLFVAIQIEEGARALLQEALDPWKHRLASGRWVPPQNWHITLVFLGQTEPASIGWAGEQLSAVAGSSPPFEAALAGLGAFPSARRAKVLWAGLDDPRGGCEGLVAKLRPRLSDRFELDDRPFLPHLTVARCDPPVSLPEEFAATSMRSNQFRVDRLILFRSVPAGPAPRYEPLEIFALTGG